MIQLVFSNTSEVHIAFPIIVHKKLLFWSLIWKPNDIDTLIGEGRTDGLHVPMMALTRRPQDLVAPFGLISPQGLPAKSWLRIQGRHREGEPGYHFSPVPIRPWGEMPTEPGRTRRRPAAAAASGGGGETEEKKEEKREKRREKRRHNVRSYSVALETIFILCALFLILIFSLSCLHCETNTLWITGALCQSLGKNISKERTTDYLELKETSPPIEPSDF